MDPVSSALELFRHRFGGEPEIVTYAPGRVNLIGEHTDTSEGFVFPAAIDRGVAVAARRSEGESVLFSTHFAEPAHFDVRLLRPDPRSGWGAYAAGMAWAFWQAGFEGLGNLEAAVASDLPIGSGLSSSAAVEIAFGLAWNELDGLGLEPLELAQFGQRAENLFVGMACGIMDQMASALGQADHALFIDTRSLDFTPVRAPRDWAWVICDTNTPHSHVDSEYNARRRQVEEAARILGVAKLRDADLAGLEAARSRLSDAVYRRARHVLTENQRCLAMVEALRAADRSRVRQLMAEAHRSIRDDYEASCRELDIMVEEAERLPGCVGVRMTGGGFGGACLALVDEEAVGEFSARLAEAYRSRAGREATLFATRPSPGARVVERAAPSGRPS